MRWFPTKMRFNLDCWSQFDVRHSALIGGGVNDDDTVQYPIAIAQKGDQRPCLRRLFMGSDDDSVRDGPRGFSTNARFDVGRETQIRG